MTVFLIDISDAENGQFNKLSDYNKIHLETERYYCNGRNNYNYSEFLQTGRCFTFLIMIESVKSNKF